MKRIVSSLAIMFCLGQVYSQTTIRFCGSVDPNGYCFLNNNKFFFSPDSTTQRIFMEVNDPKSFTGTSKLVFKIYTVSKTGEEKYSSMVEQNVQNDWMFAWLPHIFEATGKYNVKVFNDKDQLVCNKSLELFPQK